MTAYVSATDGIDVPGVQAVASWMIEAGVGTVVEGERRDLAAHEIRVLIVRPIGLPDKFCLEVEWYVYTDPSLPFGRDQLPAARNWLVSEALATIDRLSSRATVEFELATGIERLVADALVALEDEHSQLRRALDKANIRIGFLEGQLHSLNEAKAMDRKPIVRAVLNVVSSTLLAAVVAGAAGGAAEAVVADRVTDRMTPSQLLGECARIQELLDEPPN